MALVDEDLIAQYRALHAQGAFGGRSLSPYAYIVKTLILKTKAQTLLDYGCGGGLQYSHDEVQVWWRVMPTLYDPGVPAFAARPRGQFDGVICTDVLEHIPESDVDDVLRDLLGYAEKFLFLTICCRPANRILPNGVNAHVTVQPPEWWKAKIAALDRTARVRIEFTP